MFLMVRLEKTLSVPCSNQSPAELLESCDQRPDPSSLSLIWVSGVVTQRPEDGSEDESRVLRVLCRSFPASSTLGIVLARVLSDTHWAPPQSVCPGAVAAEGQFIVLFSQMTDTELLSLGALHPWFFPATGDGLANDKFLA